MSASDTAFPLPDNFNGMVRLFPLPNLVMFPHVVQPLHIFESRYREMLEDALADDRLLAMSLLQPGWETEYESRPPVYPTVCIGRVLACQRLDDGRYNLLLGGASRAKILRELPPRRSFRQAQIEVLSDCLTASAAEDPSERLTLAHKLYEALRAASGGAALIEEQIEQVRTGQAPLGMLTDIVAYTLDLPLAEKQKLLAETNVDQRARELARRLADLRLDQADDRQFPPGFSDN